MSEPETRSDGRPESRDTPLAKYRPIAKLGQGGMAQVFLAIASGPVGFNKLVVIKEILDELAEDPSFVAMFLDEARLAARLNHPNVVQTTEVGVEGRRYYICMEYLEGQPLNRIFGRLRSNELTRGMKVRMLVDTLAGLHHAHEVCDLDGTPLRVVHRDATPHNVFLTYAGQVKVVDFGIAKAASSSAKTQTGVLKGKINYMAPEHAKGEEVDRRADIFSVGMMLWDVLAGQRPFQGLNDIAIIHKLMLGEIPSLRAAAPDVPASLEAICMKALAPNRDDRFATAADMATALEEALDELGDKGSVRDAGKIIETYFANDREKVKRVIEEQVALMQRSSYRAPTALPVVDHARGEVTAREPWASSSSAPSMPSISITGSVPSRTGASLRDERQPSSITATFDGRSQAPPPVASPARKPPVAIVAASAFVVAAAAIGLFAMRGTTPATVGATALPTATTTAGPTSRVIAIDSMPQGASVREGDVELGTTPMTLKLDVAATAERRLVMSLPGYAPHTFVPTVDDVRIQVPLALLPAPMPAPLATGAPLVKPTKPAETGGRPRPPATPDDIKMTR